MKRLTVSIMLMLFVLSLAGVTFAETLDDAKALAIKAAEFIKKNGKEKGLAELNKPDNQFKKSDTFYVTAHGYDGTVLAFCVNPKLVGQNHYNMKDPTGKLFVQDQIEIAKKGGGWSTYMWTNPATKKVQSKKSWVQPVEGMDMFVLCGLFQ